MKKFNKVLLKSKAKSFLIHFKKGKSNCNYIGVMQLWISFHKRGLKKRKYKQWKLDNKHEFLY